MNSERPRGLLAVTPHIVLKIKIEVEAFLVVLTLAGCCSRQQAAAPSGKDYLRSVSTLELESNRNSRNEYDQAVVGKMRAWLEPIQDPAELKRIFHQVQAMWRSQGEVPQDRLTWIDPYYESRNLIMYRLADLQTPEAARVLVDLYYDKTIGWDAHPGEMAADALLKCGKPALPFLRERAKTEAGANALIELIEAGKKGL